MTPPLTPAPDGRVPLAGAVNFRDLGGLPVAGGRLTRRGRLYRSDSLADLTDADLQALAALGLRTLCDFRLPGEAARKPNRLPPPGDGPALKVHAIGFIPDGTLDMLAAINAGAFGPAEIEAEVLRHYVKFPRDHGAQYAALFAAILADDGLPLLMHCTSGKDRTGFGAAGVLLALGAPRDIIVADYALTNAYRRDIAHLFPNAVAPEAIATLTSANPRYIETALDEIDALGGADAWLGSLGLDTAARVRLAELLTEPA